MDSDVLRIMDVNLNRTREALRVIEDYARFVLDDADATEAVKGCRHQVRAVIEAAGADALLAARDIVSDVGRDLKTPGELERGSAEDVVRAAFGRLSEAARVLGEYGKLVSAALATAAEALRYRCYELEQRVVLRGTVRRRFRDVRLYVLLTEALCRGPWQQTAEAAIRGGAGCLQLREKQVSDRELLDRARRLRELTAARGVLLAINDRPDIARLARADILHLGQDDLSVREARRIVGASLLVGKSTHTLEQFEAALAEEPDYLSVGPMFPTGTRPMGGAKLQLCAPLAGPQTLAAARPRTALPLVAIGGITSENVGGVMAVGASCVAVCAAVIAADDVEAAARALRAAIGERAAS
jgi:thiamine-phosphate pyrophosphorylase